MAQFCGIDFGTSNSTVGIWRGDKACLVELEDSKTTLPSALFFDSEENTVSFGRNAITNYIDGYEGRLMRALKSILGNSLIHEKTRIGNKSYSFQDILGAFIKHLKEKAGEGVDHVVLGRPVFFVDGDRNADNQAQDVLEKVAKEQDFKNVSFQYEPVAAALDFEQSVTQEKLALIIDIGGGTADFSIVRVSPEGHKKVNRFDDILGSDGVHIGGTDFDRLLNLKAVMPHLGYGSYMRDEFADKDLEIPSTYFHDLATWHKINFLYNFKILDEVKNLRRKSLNKELIDRLYYVLDAQIGHSLSLEVEKAKIDLTSKNKTMIDLSFIEKTLMPDIDIEIFNTSILTMVERLQETLLNSLKVANITSDKIDAIFLTGGSTSIPFIRDNLIKLIPDASIIEGDLFGSVGTGLTLEAKRRYL